MSDEPRVRTGQVAVTPQGGPIDEGVPASQAGAGQVQPTPEAGPLSQDSELVGGEALKPPTLYDLLQGPILGLDDVPPATAPPPTASAAGREEAPAAHDVQEEDQGATATRTAQDEAELKKWPPYSGKPVSEVRWDDARRYAAPVVSQAEKLTIRAIDLSGRGLSRLARYLETRRAGRDAEAAQDDDATR
jgi:hypothetical protein